MKVRNLVYHLVLGLVIFAPITLFGQQNVLFTQYLFNSINENPAYSGYKELWNVQMNLRSQWSGWDGAPRTGAVYVDGVLDPVGKRHAVGMVLTSDKLGAQDAQSFFANYAFRIQVDQNPENRLAFGVAGGVTAYALDGNKLDAVQDGDAVLPTGKISTFRPDIRLGVHYSTARYYVGASIQDLFAGSDSENDYRFNMNTLSSLYRNIHYYFMAGGLFDLQDDLKLRPSLLVKDDFKGPTMLDLNAMFIFGPFWIFVRLLCEQDEWRAAGHA